MAQIREEATQLMSSGHITRFVYVDDKFGNKQVGKEEVKLYVQEHIEESGIVAHVEIWPDEFEDWWTSSSEEERQAFIDKNHIEAENAGDLQEKFTQILPTTLEQHYLNPEEFTEGLGNLLDGLDANHRLMILVDHRLDDYGRTGEQLLEQVANMDNIHCAIFSGTFHVEGELEKWNSFQDKSNVYSLSKDRLSSDDDNEILEGLRSVLWLKQISKVKNHAKVIFSEAYEFMKAQLDEVDPSTFHKIVLDRSEKEGCWEFETLLRMANAYLGIGIKRKMSDGGFTDFQSLTSTLRQIKRDASANKANNSIVKLISDEESYESGIYINNTFSQVSNGDVFKIGQSTREYILLCQPCNLEIRPNGKRKKEHFDQYYLVPDNSARRVPL